MKEVSLQPKMNSINDNISNSPKCQNTYFSVHLYPRLRSPIRRATHRVSFMVADRLVGWNQ